MAEFRWFEFTDRGALVEALIAIGLYGERRDALLEVLPVRLRLGLRDMPDALSQLTSDVSEINQIERLADDSVPMRGLLASAERFAGQQPEALETIRRLRADVEGRLGAGPIEPVVALEPIEIPERVIQRDDMVDFAFLLRGVAAGRAVARLEVPGWSGGAPLKRAVSGEPVRSRGTGWLIAPDLLVTCAHVIRSRGVGMAEPTDVDIDDQLARTEILFDLVDGALAPTAQVGAKVLAWAPAPLDYAILEVDGGGRSPLTLDATLVDARAHLAVNILQHPNGAPLRVALRNNLIARVEADTLAYFTDTLPGSSGAPVCDDRWQVRALHRATRSARTVRIFQGKQVKYENVGTPIGRILDDLRARWPAVAERMGIAASPEAPPSPGSDPAPG